MHRARPDPNLAGLAIPTSTGCTGEWNFVDLISIGAQPID